MTIRPELEDDIKEYANPIKLGNKILNALTKELYQTDPKRYSKLACELYESAQNDLNHVGISVLYQWLELSEYKNKQACTYLIRRKYAEDIFDLPCDSTIKYKMLLTWRSCNILPDTLQRFLYTITDHLSTTKTTDSLQDIHLLKLIINIVIPNKHAMLTPTHSSKKIYQKLSASLNKLINHIDVEKVPASEMIQLMLLYEHLDESNLTKLASLYPEGRFTTILRMAQALGTINDLDYWIQSLAIPLDTQLDKTAMLPEI